MALSQKYPGLILVPWFNSAEWKSVYNLIFSEFSTYESKVTALKVLNIWKGRMPLLSSGLEGTLLILDAMVLDKSFLEERHICAIYSFAIMKFLNLCAANTDRQGTFYRTAKQNKIPDWLIDLRHEIAHGHQSPSIEVLQIALDFSLKWLQTEYWNAQNATMTDYILEEKKNGDKSEGTAIFEAICKATWKFYQDSQIEHLDSAINGFVNTDKITNFSDMRRLQNNILKQLNENQDDYKREEFLNALVQHSKIFEVVPSEDDKGHQYLPENVIKLWEPLLLYFSKEGLFDLLEILFSPMENESSSMDSRKISGLWIAKVLTSLMRMKMLRSGKEKNVSDKEPSVFLNFKNVGNKFMGDVHRFKEFVLKNPNCEFIITFLDVLLKLCDYPNAHIVDLVTIIQAKTINNGLLERGRLHTLEDFQNEYEDKLLIDLCSRFEEECTNGENGFENGAHFGVGVTFSGIEKPRDKLVTKIPTGKPKRWRRVLDTSSYRKLPLGVMPNQDRYRNPCLTYL